MSQDKPPPTAHERDKLIAQRKKEGPAPSPAPRPKGMGLSHAEKVAHYERQKNAFNREERIKEINSAIDKKRGVAKSGFDRVR